MSLRFFDSKRPFDVKRWPGYYGWMILAVGTLGMIAAVPGSPPGMSVFVDDMLAALEIDRSSFALSYTLGTITAGLCAPYAGHLVDRFGARVMGCVSFFGLGLVLIFTGLLDRVYAAVSGIAAVFPVSFLLVFVAFTGIRLMGVSFGMTTCRSMVFRWFEGKRGWAAAINGTMLSLSFSSAPLLLNGIVLTIGWRSTWISLGILFSMGMTLLAYFFFRDSPESCGVEIEQSAIKSKNKIRIPVVRDFTAPEAIRTHTFWIFISGLALNGLIGTGVSFHIIAVGAVEGVGRDASVAVFLPSAIFHVSTTLLIGRFAEHFKMKHVLMIMVIAQAVSLIGVANFSDSLWRWVYIVGNGVSWGIFGILINLPWARFFGRKHLGAVNGWVTGATVVTSALGPYLFGLSYELTGSFAHAFWCSLALCPVVFILSFFADNPQVKYQVQ